MAAKGTSLKSKAGPPTELLVGVALVIAVVVLLLSTSERRTLPVSPDDWPRPTEEELAQLEEPRYFPQDPNAVLTLTIDTIKLYDAPVIDSASEADLDRGVIHLPQTPMPDEEGQKNVYLAAHRVGNPDTAGRMLFFKLDELKKGDSVVLTDRSGSSYEYRVSEMFTVYPVLSGP